MGKIGLFVVRKFSDRKFYLFGIVGHFAFDRLNSDFRDYTNDNGN